MDQSSSKHSCSSTVQYLYQQQTKERDRRPRLELRNVEETDKTEINMTSFTLSVDADSEQIEPFLRPEPSGKVPILRTDTLRLSQSQDVPKLAAVFCPSNLLSSDDHHATILSLLHPFLAQNFAISGLIVSTPSLVVLDLSHTPTQLMDDLLDVLNNQVIHSGPEAILKVLLISNIQVLPDKPSLSIDVPTCAVCLHRIEPTKIGQPRPRKHHLCSKYCPPPNLEHNTAVCPRQRLLQPWTSDPCPSCAVIQSYWRGELNACQGCEINQTLWVCLTCSFVGCGRYSNKHAAQHYDESRHPFCLELSTLRIWSYLDGEFAHRADLLECPSSPPLLQPWVVHQNTSTTASHVASLSQTDTGWSARPSEAEPSHVSYDRRIAADFASALEDKTPKKAIMIGEEYEALLQSALEEQAQHYEGEITRLRASLTAEHVDKNAVTDNEAKSIETLRTTIARLRSEIEDTGRVLLDSQAREAEYRSSSQRLLREQQVAQGVLEKIRQDAAAEHESYQQQVEELEMQIADLTANQKMMQQFASSEDLKNSQIIATEQSPPPKARKGKKNRKLFRR